MDAERKSGFEPRADGASGTRTRDLLGAIQALSQLSYSPTVAAGHGQPSEPRPIQRRIGRILG
jgi:hypothetical protein